LINSYGNKEKQYVLSIKWVIEMSMIKNMFFGMALLMVSSASFADEYSCKVHCLSGSGSIESTQTTVNASNSSDAAKSVGDQSDQVCRAAGYEKSTSASMGDFQCSKN
jgi:hypothetical protein